MLGQPFALANDFYFIVDAVVHYCYASIYKYSCLVHLTSLFTLGNIRCFRIDLALLFSLALWVGLLFLLNLPLPSDTRLMLSFSRNRNLFRQNLFVVNIGNLLIY